VVDLSRHRQIADAVQDAGSLTVVELARLTGASDMTIRRDLDVLSTQGVLERIRGGARTLLLRGEEPPYTLRRSDAVEAKLRIAQAVSGLLADGESVVLDSGTTCVEVARVIHDRRLTVMPLSLHAVSALADTRTVTLLVPGGQPRPDELALTGPLTEASIASLRFDTAILGCCALSVKDGLTAHDLADAVIKRAAIASARRVIAATDSTKLTRTALAYVSAVQDLDAVVTDRDAPADIVADFEAAGVVVHRV
jgi:DeoR/GlpR family transcriptional regulator of sugar metabolism